MYFTAADHAVQNPLMAHTAFKNRMAALTKQKEDAQLRGLTAINTNSKSRAELRQEKEAAILAKKNFDHSIEAAVEKSRAMEDPLIRGAPLGYLQAIVQKEEAVILSKSQQEELKAKQNQPILEEEEVKGGDKQ